MHGLKKVSIVLLMLLSFTGCFDFQKEDYAIDIALSNWTGYLPLAYAYEKGKLKDLGINIIPTSSLSASLNLIGRDAVDGFCATQREYKLIKSIHVDITPIILLDKSYGGDKILSNMTKDELYSLKKGEIDAHMEFDSANYLLFEYFKNFRDWEKVNFTIKNNTQSFISQMPISNPSIIVTYEPYATTLLRRGFHLIESTKNDKILIMDAVFVKKKSFEKNKEIYKKLKIAVDESIEELKTHPKAFYDVIKIYTDGQSFDDFNATLQDVKWMNKNKDSVLEQLKKENIETGDFL